MPIAGKLIQFGVRWASVPDLSNIHPECCIEVPSDISAEVHLFQKFQVGAFTHINGGFIKDVTIGRYCSFARDVQIGHGFHPLSWLSVSPLQYFPGYRGWMAQVARTREVESLEVKTVNFSWASHTTIGNDVWLGNHVIIKDGITIGDGAVIGANAVVTHDVPPYAIVVGNPGRVIKFRFPDVVIERLLKVQWWRFSVGDFQAVEFSNIERALDVIEAAIDNGLQPYVAPTLNAERLRELVA